MKKGRNYILSIIGIYITTVLIFGQGSGYLSQKLMVENDIRNRVKEALSKVIDSHKYVINVDVNLEVMDEVNEQITVFAPREPSTKRVEETSPAEKTAKALVKIQEKMIQDDISTKESYSIGLPIPGFEVDLVRPESGSNTLRETSPVSPKTMEPMDEPSQAASGEEKEVVGGVFLSFCTSRENKLLYPKYYTVNQ